MLAEYQLKFVEDNFNVDKAQLLEMSEAEWDDVRLKCFSLETGGTTILKDGSAEITKKGKIAAEIADIPYKKMKKEEQ